MKALIAKLFGAGSASRNERLSTPPSGPDKGHYYAFRTKPYNEFAHPETGRYAALKIIGSSNEMVAVAVLDRIWSGIPTLKEARSANLLCEHRFAHTGKPAVFGVVGSNWLPNDELGECFFLGSGSVTRKESGMAQLIINGGIGARYANLRSASSAAEGEWRWEHDRAALEAEHERRVQKAAAERAAQEERYRTRLSKLTWDQLLAETPFENWSPSPPYPPEEFTQEARNTIRQACLALQALGPKPRKAAARKILKEVVLWFNAADAAAGHVIESEEREDIFAVLEEMAHVARQKSLVEEIDALRDW